MFMGKYLVYWVETVWCISLDIQAPHFADQQILPSSLYRHHYCVLLNYYLPQSGCGKVVFLHLSVSHSVNRGVWTDTPWADTPPPRADTLLGRLLLGKHPPGQTPPSGGYCIGRYASYWNAILLQTFFWPLYSDGICGQFLELVKISIEINSCWCCYIVLHV